MKIEVAKLNPDEVKQQILCHKSDFMHSFKIKASLAMLDFSCSYIKQFYCSTIQHFDSWMTTKILCSSFNFSLFYPPTSNR
jgi:hypothetical protein